MTGPVRVPAPPTITMSIASNEVSTPRIVGEMNWVEYVYSTPAMPANRPAMTNTMNRWSQTLYPLVLIRNSLSLMPRNVRPNGDRTKRYIEEARNEADAQGDVVEGEVGVQRIEWPSDPVQTQVPARHLSPVLGEPPEHLREHQRHHEEEEAGQSHRERAPDRRGGNARDQCDRDRELPTDVIARAEDRDRVSGHAEEGGLTQRLHPRVAHQ